MRTPSMNKKIALILAAVAAACVLVAGAYLLYRAYAPGGQGVVVRPAVMGALKASASTSVTILLNDGSEKTFALTKYTQIITRVFAGEVGKTLDQVESGATLVVQPDAADASSAASVSIMPALSTPASSPEGPPVSLVGRVVNVTPATLTLETQSQGIVNVAVSENSQVYSNVLAGQTGKTYADIAPGMQVVVSGITGLAGIKANSIQLLVLLGR